MKNPRKITFNDPTDVEAVVLAQLGRSSAVIAAHCPGLVSHEAKNVHSRINYRLKIAAREFGLEKGRGFRSTWRDGTSPIAQEVTNQFLPKLRKQTHSYLASQLATRQAEFVAKHPKEPKAQSANAWPSGSQNKSNPWYE